MQLRFAHLADYAAADAAGKLTIVGAFDIIWDRAKDRPIQFPPCYLVASFAASIAEGAEHKLVIDLLDADENPHGFKIDAGIALKPFGPGYPMRGHAIIGFGPGAVTVPELGDYHFRFEVDGQFVGEVPVSVLEPSSAD